MPHRGGGMERREVQKMKKVNMEFWVETDDGRRITVAWLCPPTLLSYAKARKKFQAWKRATLRGNNTKAVFSGFSYRSSDGKK